MESSDSIADGLPNLTSAFNNFPDDSNLGIIGNNHGRASPIHWITVSDTMIVSPAVGRAILEVIVCSGTENPIGVTSDGQPSTMKRGTGVRSQSVSNLSDKKLRHSDEEVSQMKNKFLLLAELRNRRFFRLLEKKQKWTLALICAVYFFCFSAISMLSPFFIKVYIPLLLLLLKFKCTSL